MKPFHLSVCRLLSVSLLLAALHSGTAIGQSGPGELAPVLSEEIQSPAVSIFQMKQYLLRKAAKPPAPASC